MNDYDRQRREALGALLAGGALALAPAEAAQAFLFGGKPDRLAEDRSIHSLAGEVLVNGRPATLETRIRAGDSVSTGGDGKIVFAVGGDSFLLRRNGNLEIGGSDFLVRSLRVLSGALLSVFARRDRLNPVAMSASTATIGIRGTGVYVEVEPRLAYVCTCYGQVSLAAAADPSDSETIETTNHDMPRYIDAAPTNGSRIRPAPVINHENDELELLEAIVGRKVPPGFGKESYER